MILDRKINIVIPTVDFGVLIEMWKSVGSYNDKNLVKYPERQVFPKNLPKAVDEILKKFKDESIIIETHSQDLVNYFRYLVFKGKVKPNEIVINYDDGGDEFIEIFINERSKFTNKDNEVIKFPSGFFDVVLDELVEMM